MSALILWDESASPITEQEFYRILHKERYSRHFRNIENRLKNGANNANQALAKEQIDDAVKHTLQFCWFYYLTCLPPAKQSRRSSGVRRAAKDTMKYAVQLQIAVKTLFRSPDLLVAKVCESIQLDVREFCATLEILERACSLLLDKHLGLPKDSGGKNPSKAFSQLVCFLTGQYIILTNDNYELGTQNNCFLFISAVLDLLVAIKDEFPKVKFDLPQTTDAFRKHLERMAA